MHRVAVDVLTAEDHLYDGYVGDYFLDTNGELSGLLLTEPRRFDRQGYLEAKRNDSTANAVSFWRTIPGRNMYVPRDKILNMNLRYPKPDETGKTLAERANRQLAQAGLQLELVPEDSPEESSGRGD